MYICSTHRNISMGWERGLMKETARARKDISNLADIKLLVDTFYGKVRQNTLIAPIFDAVIRDKWPIHLEKMYAFWQTVLLGEHTYQGAPFPPHAKLPIEKRHFDQWTGLFNQTVDELFEGRIAEEAKWRADKMAQVFINKLDYYREKGLKPLA